MANNLGTLSSALILQTALELVFTKRPILSEISTDFSNDSVLFNQQIITRLKTIPNVLDFGSAAQDKTTIDVPVTINLFKEIKHKFTVQELSSTNRNLVEEAAEPMAVAIANYLVDTLCAQWTLTNFPNTQETVTTVANSGYSTIVALRKALQKRGTPDQKRFGVFNADVYEKFLNDPTIIQRQINPNQMAIVDGNVMQVAGFGTLFEYPLMPTVNNMTGFVGTKDSVILAGRVPQDPRSVLPNAPFPGSMGVIKDAKTGFSIMVTEYVDPVDLSANIRACFMVGYAPGQTVNGQRLCTAAN